MKKTFYPYYISRAILSAVFAVIMMGFTWKATILTMVFFGLFLLYLHSGWFSIDLKNPLMPLRRDAHGQAVQRKALIASVVAASLVYMISSQVNIRIGTGLTPGSVALAVGVMVYFASQFILFSRS